MKPATPDDNPLGLLASKAPDDKLNVAVGSGASIAAASPSVERATARDGTVVQLRPLRPNERELAAGSTPGCRTSPGAAASWGPMPRLPQAMLRRLVAVDGRRHVAVVAAVDGHCVGIARWIALAGEPGTAEVAVAVTDRYRAAASAGRWSRPCGRLPSAPAWPPSSI